MRYLRSYCRIAVILLAGLSACGGDEEKKQGFKRGAAAAALNVKVDGQKVFRTYCVSCHGIKGNMGVNGAANLRKSSKTIPERVTIITHGKGVMTPFKSILTPEEINAVAEYTLTLKNKP